MSIKLQEAENIVYEGKSEDKIFAMWFFTKVIPCSVSNTVYTLAFFMICWIFYGAVLSGGKGVAEPSHPLIIGSIVLLFWFVILLIYYNKLKDTFSYYITNQRCVFSGGIMVKRLRNVPFHKITDVEINQNIVERLLNIYSLKIFTPGTGSIGMPGFEKAEIVFYGIKDAEGPAQIIQATLKKYKATGE